jgi:tetratricopeptide (TPR) repeat protein
VRALRYDPSKIRGDGSEAHALRGYLFEWQGQGQRERALAEYESTLQEDPDHLWALYRACVVRFQLGGSNRVDKELLNLLLRLTSHDRFEELVAEHPDAIECLDHLTFGLTQKLELRQADELAIRAVSLAQEYGGSEHLALAYYSQAQLARWIANDAEGVRIEYLVGPGAFRKLPGSPDSIGAIESARQRLVAWSTERLERARKLSPSAIDHRIAEDHVFHTGWYGDWLEDQRLSEMRGGLRSFPFWR